MPQHVQKRTIAPTPTMTNAHPPMAKAFQFLGRGDFRTVRAIKMKQIPLVVMAAESIVMVRPIAAKGEQPSCRLVSRIQRHASGKQLSPALPDFRGRTTNATLALMPPARGLAQVSSNASLELEILLGS